MFTLILANLITLIISAIIISSRGIEVSKN